MAQHKHQRTRSERRAATSKRSDEAAAEQQRLVITSGLERLFRIEEIALMGGAKRAKLYEHVKSGLLPTVKIGILRRVTESGYRQYLSALAEQSAAA